MTKSWKTLLTPLVIVGAALLIGRLLIAMGPTSAPAPQTVAPLAVEVLHVSPARHTETIYGTGIVTPEQRVELVPEVGGRIVWVSDDLRPGAAFAEGQPIARIDGRDHKAALAAEHARLRQAELELALEEQRQKSAEREWALLNSDPESAGSDLALRRPQRALALASVESAKASVERATRNVQRTTLRAPFNAVVLSEQLDVGQTVGGAPVAVLAGSDRARVSIQVTEASIPSLPRDRTTPATVTQQNARGSFHYPARVLGLEGQLDPATRTAAVVLVVDQPYAPAGDQPPLLPGSFVEAAMPGVAHDALFALPRRAVVDGTIVWTVVEDALKRSELTVLFSDADHVYARTDLAPNAAVVISRLTDPIDGQPVTVVTTRADAH